MSLRLDMLLRRKRGNLILYLCIQGIAFVAAFLAMML
jgi:hypothetical protein